jgi:hypothetical protein
MYRRVGMNFFVRHLNFLRPALMQGVGKLGIAALLAITGYANASARDNEFVPDEFRLAYAVQKFDSTWAGVLAYDLPPIRFLGSKRSELAVGTIYANGDWAALISGGPIWSVDDIGGSRMFVEFSINPTLLSRTHYDGEDMGSHFQFTSALVLGRRFANWRVALRIQHTSNAGLSDANPGMDMVAVAISRR